MLAYLLELALGLLADAVSLFVFWVVHKAVSFKWRWIGRLSTTLDLLKELDFLLKMFVFLRQNAVWLLQEVNRAFQAAIDILYFVKYPLMHLKSLSIRLFKRFLGLSQLSLETFKSQLLHENEGLFIVVSYSFSLYAFTENTSWLGLSTFGIGFFLSWRLPRGGPRSGFRWGELHLYRWLLKGINFWFRRRLAQAVLVETQLNAKSICITLYVIASLNFDMVSTWYPKIMKW